MGRIWLSVGLSVCISAAAWPQDARDRPGFEVASIKPSKQGSVSGMGGGPGTKDPGRFTATSTPLSWLVMYAYGLDGDDRLTRPAWTDKAVFDVAANVPAGTSREQFRKMLQNLLADRFGMRVHHETRVVPVYELTVAKNGPKLKPAAVSAGVDNFVPGSGARPVDRNGFPILPPGRMNFACGYLLDGAHCTYRMVTIGQLAARLGGPTLSGAGRRVVDKTGLGGAYDFTLYFRPVDGPENDAPSIEQALQEQLGLKLVPSKASIDVVIVDYAEKVPTEN